MKIVIKILFTILLTIQNKNHIFHLQIFSMTDQDLFYLFGQGVLVILWPKTTYPLWLCRVF
jgi:hypothetical protein